MDVESLLLNKEIQQFIKEHIQTDTAKLMLQAAKYPKWPFAQIMEQIQARQKAADKLPQLCSQAAILFPASLSIEQCSSEQTAKYKASIVRESDSLADLTGGFGIDTLAFATHIAKVYHIEQNERLSSIAAHNFSILTLTNITCIAQEGINWLKHQNQIFDSIYIDPARRDQHNRKMVSLADCAPNILSHLPLLLKKSKQILIKTSPLLDIHQTIQSLEGVAEIHIVAVNNECKEVLYLIKPDYQSPATIKAINIKKDGTLEEFAFTIPTEQALSIPLSLPLKYLYEPNVAILKAGAFKSIAKLYGLYKLHNNTHLYTSDTLLMNFPGRIFDYQYALKVDSKEVSALFPNKQALLIVRNFPMSTDDLLKKLKIKQGGDQYLLATTLLHNKHTLLFCKRIV